MQIRYQNVHKSVIYLFVSKSFIIKQLKLVFYNKEQNNYLCNHGVNSNAMSSVFELRFFLRVELHLNCSPCLGTTIQYLSNMS
jgi:hypothetical protein